ncbi:ABC transporter permease subunit [Taylorella equigenitalis]|uniref:ABC transporter permease subunit n=1 Tax=Taylorella equigenitalis TaxID=29575 RepID=UPI0003FEA1AA|nr:ABC transporter permease subunit [Taylorella equigenitalis]ASY30171.1 dipeptide ABC transporter permease DppC [Taylorella equigenitalis]
MNNNETNTVPASESATVPITASEHVSTSGYVPVSNPVPASNSVPTSGHTSTSVPVQNKSSALDIREAVQADIEKNRESFDYPSPLKDFLNHFFKNKGAVIGLLFLLLMILVAIFAPYVAPYSPVEQFRDHMLQPPVFQEGGTSQFILGTDEAGRDILSRIIHGGRLSLFIGICAVVLTLIPGVILGLLAGFYPKVLGKLIMRFADIMMALPSVLLAIAIMAIMGPGIVNAMIAIAVVGLPGYIRLVRGSVISELNKDYVTAAKLSGASIFRLMFVAVFPNCMAPIIVQATLGFSSAILDVAALGFLGLGVQPPSPEWGTMLATARDYISRAWWVVTFPGLTILLTVIAINLMGDGLRDALDPKLKQAA